MSVDIKFAEAGHTLDVEAYRRMVRNLASRSDGTVFMNSGPDFASVVMNEIASNASKSLNIYAGTLSKDVYSIEVFDKVLRQPGFEANNLKIVLEKGSEPRNNELVQELHDRGAQLREYRATGAHLAVADDCHFRFEYDVKEMKAMCGFGSNESDNSPLQKLTRAFDDIWKSAEPVQVTEGA